MRPITLSFASQSKTKLSFQTVWIGASGLVILHPFFQLVPKSVASSISTFSTEPSSAARSEICRLMCPQPSLRQRSRNDVRAEQTPSVTSRHDRLHILSFSHARLSNLRHPYTPIARLGNRTHRLPSATMAGRPCESSPPIRLQGNGFLTPPTRTLRIAKRNRRGSR